MPGQQGQVNFDGDVFLAAEPAPDQCATDANLVVRHADSVGNGAKVLDDLGRNPNIADFVFIEPGEPDLRLEKTMFLEWGFVRIFDDQVGG